MKKVILFGGSFDPIHYGHLTMAKQALLQQGAFELWFIPNQVSPFKETSSNFDARVRMIEMMIHAQPQLKVCTIEKDLPKPSYSITTVDALKKIYPEYTFEWLIGDDQLDKLPGWKDFERMNQEIDFIVYSRSAAKHDYKVIEGDILPISSTKIRQGLQTATKPSILRYMMEEGLYLDSMIKERLSDERYQHSLRVTEVALEFGKHHRLDLKQVRLVAMMHDYCKENYSDVYYDKGDVAEEVYHGYAAAAILSKRYYIKDRKVLRAIRGHVTASSTTDLGMVLYCADKCERGRTYDTESWIIRVKQDLRKTFKQLVVFTNEYRKKA